MHNLFCHKLYNFAIVLPRVKCRTYTYTLKTVYYMLSRTDGCVVYILYPSPMILHFSSLIEASASLIVVVAMQYA